MELKLEQLDYQEQAIKSVVTVFNGQNRNNFDNACRGGIRTNNLTLTDDEISQNIRDVLIENGIDEKTASLSKKPDLCIEMETGTGKTLVYLKTIYELHKHYGFTKFIVLVPSVAIKEGVLKTLNTFEQQLEEIYNLKPDYFEYDSSQLPNVKKFVEEQHPQIMVMTLQSFNTEERIFNQQIREDLFLNMSYIKAVASTKPIIIMDEPQEGMDTENSSRWLSKLNPLVKIRYSATHKVFQNLIYRLTPYESYQKGLVKKIEVLSVTEKYDEASMKIELAKIKLGSGEPKAILKAWHKLASGRFKFKNTRQLVSGVALNNVTKSSIYPDYVVEKIAKPISGRGYVKFKNGVKIFEGERADPSIIFNEQLYWLIYRHFEKKKLLKKRFIKCLSLIFIDRVANYIEPDGSIKRAFVRQYKKAYRDFYGRTTTSEQIDKCQGYYFAQTQQGKFTDNLNSMAKNRKMFDLILKDKQELLNINNAVEFIFSHSALGVGWDNPNIFQIATLNHSYSEIKKRQELGRGLRICVNQQGYRVYDPIHTKEGEEVNLLTIVPNETYHTFVSQYHSEIKEIYGSNELSPATRNNHKGQNTTEKRIYRNDNRFNESSFQKFWERLSRKTEYIVWFDEERIIEECITAINEISIPKPALAITLGKIQNISEESVTTSGNFRSDTKAAFTDFAPIDLVKEISNNTSLAYCSVLKIVNKLDNKKQILNNPPRFVQETIKAIKNILLEEMYRGLKYSEAGESYDLELFENYIVTHTKRVEPTPNRGIYDHVVWESEFEQCFATQADIDVEVVCFLKLPSFYVIDTPAGKYNPDFGLVLRKKRLVNNQENEYYFVIETKGTNDLNDRKAMTQNEIDKIHCARKHFEALGVETRLNFIAPVKEFANFTEKAEGTLNV